MSRYLEDVAPGHRLAEEVQVVTGQDPDGNQGVALIVRPQQSHGSTPMVLGLTPGLARALAGQLLDMADWCERDLPAPEGEDG